MVGIEALIPDLCSEIQGVGQRVPAAITSLVHEPMQDPELQGSETRGGGQNGVVRDQTLNSECKTLSSGLADKCLSGLNL